MYIPLGTNPAVSWLTFGICGVTFIILVTMRFGLLTIAAAMFVTFTLVRFPLTFDFRLWYADTSLYAIALAAGVAVFGFVTARAVRTPRVV